MPDATPGAAPDAAIELPAVVGGRLLALADAAHSHTLEYGSGLTLRMPALEHAHLDQVVASRTALLEELGRLTIHDVTSLFARVGERWLDPGYPIRQKAQDQAARVTGYAPRMILLDYNFLGYVLRQRPYVYDYIESELGSERIMDEWCRVKASWVRAFPQGIVLHSMVGNVPLANAFTLVWALMTRNLSIAKVPARDPVTPLALAQAFVDVAPDHPLTRGLTVGYWGRDSSLGDAACQAANLILAWGGAESVGRIKQKAPAGTPVVEFGPKWSLAVVDLDRCDAEVAAWRMAADVVFYDQEACLSPQRLFVKGDRRHFIERLQHYLDRAGQHIPRECHNADALAHVALTRLEAEFRGWDLHAGAGWTVIEVDDPAEVVEHPLGRTLFVHPVDDLGQIQRYLNVSAQTLCVEPWELAMEHRDAWGVAGVHRIVELGMSRRPQAGYVHDGIRPLSRLVRWVTVEQGVHDFYKYGDFTPQAVEERLFPWLERAR